MIPVVNSEQMKIVERHSIETQKISITALMEAAGLMIAEVLMDMTNGLEDPAPQAVSPTKYFLSARKRR